MLDIVTFKWKPPAGYRSKFGPEAVNTLARMVARNYQKPHRFTCVTDDPRGIDPSIRVIPLWADHSGIANPMGPRNPSCYRRLKLFSAEAAEIIGPRFVHVDLDIVITSDLAPLWDREEDFVIWKNPSPPTPYNGSMFLLKAGTRTKVWSDFDPQRSPKLTRGARIFGSDQAWISYRLKGETVWDERDGVYSYRIHVAPKAGALPENARVVVFHGADDPWGPVAQRLPWVRQHWQ